MRLFKFRPIGAPETFHRRALSEIIIGGRLWFSRPSKFDDKLDCRPVVQVADSARLRRWLIKNHKVPAINPRKPTSREVTALMLKHRDIAWLEERWFVVADGITGVCCLSSDYNLDFQWENYGDANRGVCIEIETDEHAGGIEPRPVVYDDARPQVYIDQFVDDEAYRIRKTFDVLTRKSTRFELEKEYRLLTCDRKMPEYGVNHEFDIDMFKRIYLGKEITGEHADVIYSLADQSPINWEVVRI